MNYISTGKLITKIICLENQFLDCKISASLTQFQDVGLQNIPAACCLERLTPNKYLSSYYKNSITYGSVTSGCL